MTSTSEVHPFRTAWQTRELAPWIDALAPDIVLYSPILTSPFRGREAASELFSVLFESISDVDITDEFANGNSHLFLWRAHIGGRVIEGADLMRHHENGAIYEIRVLIRPLVDIATFAAAIGPPLASGRGSIRGALTRVMTRPLRVVFGLVDKTATRLIQSH